MMKKSLFFVIFSMSFLYADSYICKIDTTNCKHSLTVLASNLVDAKKDAVDFFVNSYSCQNITTSDVSCHKSPVKMEKEAKKDILVPAPMVEVSAPPKVIKRIKRIRSKRMRKSVVTRNRGIQYKGTRGIFLGSGSLIMSNKFNTEGYSHKGENNFKEVSTSPLSTFSTDVDTASYSNTRRILMTNSQLPVKGAVRVEEFINYFDYDYKQPLTFQPFNINLRVGESLWSENKIIQIGLQTKKSNISKLLPSNFVFLLDVSGSMGRANKLPLLQKSLKLLVRQLRAVDRVSIVVYAGAAGVVLDRARGDEREKIIKALDSLRAGGSTAGGAGIELAYDIALKAFIKNGNNRVILATDGDFNVGQSSESSLVSMIEEKRKSGIYLSILGFGMGNYKDNKMEMLSNKGNGNYAYIDNLLEAKKVLVTQMSGTLYTVAKDVKIQVEFNPALVHSYRLIGYENRTLANEDFNNDKKDAGEIGMGHRVTALYEIKMKNGEQVSQIDNLKYQKPVTNVIIKSDELATVKIRYKNLMAKFLQKWKKLSELQAMRLAM